jgi:phytoene dehydrogenase-like protein
MTKGTFEARVISDLDERGVAYQYEPEKLAYYVLRHYIPDLAVHTSVGTMIVELKGYFRQDAQRKMKAVKEQHPELDVRFVFQKAEATVQGAKKRKDGSKMTCAEWADRNGFTWAEGTVPKEWLQ